MTVIKVAILGFGTVGEGVYRTIESHADDLEAVLGKKVEVAAILIKNKQRERNIRKNILVTTNFEDILNLPKLDIVIEAIVNKEPTYTFLQKAIERGCHIITANKEMFAHHGKQLIELAEQNNVSVGFEATVAGGIPVIQTLKQLLKINRVQQIQGILNGTSNFILTEMREKKWSFAEALLQAQENGYAEADPTNDVEGFDAFYKTMILSRLAFGEEPNWQDVEREGITSITSELIDAAEKLGLRFKHIASISNERGQIQVSVKPALVGKENPFYHVEGVENAVSVHSDIVGRITLQGPGAGMFPTASAVIEDLVYVCLNTQKDRSFKVEDTAVSDQQRSCKEELWFVHAQSNYFQSLPSNLIEQTFKQTYIIRATKREVEGLANQDKEISYFPIVGEYQTANEDKVLTAQ
ncbi:homoserine dehydrogenase [Neobacillus sp. NRS-1170]|uniref:homoserine dehydrogenase n=1 Tax=Neobacillus sp. NRS-1170 TaxID=3233898 RepID=UPI003D2CFD8B